jgi:hypothetical protein
MSVLNKQDVILPYGVTANPIVASGGYAQVIITSATTFALTVPEGAVSCSIVYEDSAATSGVVARYCFSDIPTDTFGNPMTHLMYFELYGLEAMNTIVFKAFTALTGTVNVQFYR